MMRTSSKRIKKQFSERINRRLAENPHRPLASRSRRPPPATGGRGGGNGGRRPGRVQEALPVVGEGDGGARDGDCRPVGEHHLHPPGLRRHPAHRPPPPWPRRRNGKGWPGNSRGKSRRKMSLPPKIWCENLCAQICRFLCGEVTCKGVNDPNEHGIAPGIAVIPAVRNAEQGLP